MTEADTYRKFVVPLLQAAGWDNEPHFIAEQRYFTAGRIVSQGPLCAAPPTLPKDNAASVSYP